MLQPSSKSPSILLLHRDKLHCHAFLGFAALDDGAGPYLPRRHIKQQLYESSGRRRVLGPNVQAAQSKISHMRYVPQASALPSQNRAVGRGKTRIATKVVSGRHGNTRKNDTLFQCTIEDIPLTANQKLESRNWKGKMEIGKAKDPPFARNRLPTFPFEGGIRGSIICGACGAERR